MRAKAESPRIAAFEAALAVAGRHRAAGDTRSAFTALPVAPDIERLLDHREP